MSGHDRRYSPEVSPRLSWDPTHYVRVREVREDKQGGIIPTQIRILACEFPSASDRTHIVGFCVGLTATFSWCFLLLLLLLGECFDFLSQRCEPAGVSLQSVQTYLSRHLKGETVRLTGQTWPGSWFLGFFITYSCHCCCWLVSLLVHLVHKGLCWCC